MATLLAAIAQTVVIERRIRREIPRSPAEFHFASWLGISLPLLAAGACEVVMQTADVLLLNYFRTPSEIGVYYAATKTASLALFVQYAVGTAYAGRLATASALADHASVRQLVREAVRWTFIPSLAITLAILAAGLPLLSLFGAGFADAYPLMFILAVGVLARAATGPSEHILNMLGQQRASAASFATGAVACVGLNALLIPLWGVTGAAIATASSLTTVAFLNWLAARRLLGLDIFVLARVERKNAIGALWQEYARVVSRDSAKEVRRTGH
jgi:O-antigen/teichoic acid export membrane protein